MAMTGENSVYLKNHEYKNKSSEVVNQKEFPRLFWRDLMAGLSLGRKKAAPGGGTAYYSKENQTSLWLKWKGWRGWRDGGMRRKDEEGVRVERWSCGV